MLIKDLIYESMNTQQTRATLAGINSEQCANAARYIIQQKITVIFLFKFILKTVALAIFIGKEDM